MITQVAPVHLEGFKSIEGVLNGKMEITSSRNLRGFLYNADNQLLCNAAKAVPCNVRSVGNGQNANFRIEDIRFDFDSESNSPSLAFKLSHGDDASADIRAGVWGEHISMPLALAAAAGNCLGMSLDDCAAALRGFQGLSGRGRILTLTGDNGDTRFIVDDAYNANPASMRASLETFVKLKQHSPDKTLVAVLGEMREMGTDAPKYHSELAPLITQLDTAILVGDQDLWHLVPENPKITFVKTWQEALAQVQACKWQGLLAKGSLSVGLPNLVAALTGSKEGMH